MAHHRSRATLKYRLRRFKELDAGIESLGSGEAEPLLADRPSSRVPQPRQMGLFDECV